MWTSVSHHLISYARYMSHFIFPTWASLFVYIFSPVWATISTHLNFPTLVTRFAPLLFSMRAHMISTLFPCLLSPLSAIYSTLLTPRVWNKRFAYFFSFVWPSWRHSYLEKLKGHGVTYSVILCKLLSLSPFLSPNILSLAPYFQNSLSCLTKRDQLSPHTKTDEIVKETASKLWWHRPHPLCRRVLESTVYIHRPLWPFLYIHNGGVFYVCLKACVILYDFVRKH
jgi:hypothetical protein